MNFNETVALLHNGLGIDKAKLVDWLYQDAKN